MPGLWVRKQKPGKVGGHTQGHTLKAKGSPRSSASQSCFLPPASQTAAAGRPGPRCREAKGDLASALGSQSLHLEMPLAAESIWKVEEMDVKVHNDLCLGQLVARPCFGALRS